MMSPSSRRLLPLLTAAGSLAALSLPAAAPARVAAGSAAQRSNVPGLTPKRYAGAFIKRHGSHLTVAGRAFRFSGGNAESLGLANYGPNPSRTAPVGSERYATKFEIDDALATMHEMGATVVRAQTLGDTIGCSLCLEPTLGRFNPRAFAEMDLVAAEARRYGVKLIGEFDGDANGTAPFGATKAGGVLGNASRDWYCAWRHVTAAACPIAAFTDPRLIGDYERHMKAVLDHVNPRTGLAYKNDPTFAGWVDGNNLDLLSPLSTAQFATWLRKVSSFYKTIDRKQLFVDISAPAGDHLPSADTLGFTPDDGLLPNATVIHTPGVDMFGQEWYPKFFTKLNRASGVAKEAHVNAKAIAAAGKAYATIEFGWDRRNYFTHTALTGFLAGLAADPHVSGTGFWEMVAHRRGHGWQPIPADAGCKPSCDGLAEDGNWWAFYYTGVRTASNSAADMFARGQILRRHMYRMDGFRATPRHERVPAPRITSTRGRTVRFEGSAGAPRYSVQKLGASGRWATPCLHCTTDAANGWKDPTAHAGCYRVVGDNLDGVAGPASAAAGTGCRRVGPRARL
jgi:mannan endo-1,4-beta-mannosidase